MSATSRHRDVARGVLTGMRRGGFGALFLLAACAQIAGIEEPTLDLGTGAAGMGGEAGNGGGGAGGTGGGVGGGGAGGGGAGGGGMGGEGGCAPAEAEDCNGIDDDCNGKVDDLPLVTCGMGVCQVSVEACVDGMPAECAPKVPNQEICNGLDDDCDGSIDEMNPGGGMSCITGQLGPCAMGVTECLGGMLTCKPNAMPVDEVCNNLDDDCDGTADDGDPGGGMMCPTGLLGECAMGSTSCLVGALSCIAPMAVEDVCDGLDNDCDGEADNHGVGEGMACMTGLAGECSTGVTACEMGMIKCNQSKMSEPESCDTKDNDCDGMVDEDNPGGGGTCSVVGQKGACAAGSIVCQSGVLTCTQVTQASAEVCDGVDNDCDGDIDEGITCGTCQSTIIASGSCVSMQLPATVTLTETCKQVFPPATGIPVTIAEPGMKYYVSPAGNDNNDGTTPAKAWATLCRAIAMVPPGNTILVAQGAYLSSTVIVAKAVTVKGGFDSAFTMWNPDANPTIFHGRLTLDHASAVWGGFRLIANPIALAQPHHLFKSGLFVRNYVEAVFSSGVTSQSSALDATACPGATLSLTGNDIYAGASNATPLRAVGFGYQRGAVTLDSNRICVQGKTTGVAYGLSGFGPNTADVGTMVLRNNVLETASNGYVIFTGGQNGGVDLVTTMTNNTLLAFESGVGGTAAINNGKMRWRLTNNIIFNLTNNGTGVSLGSGAGVSFDSAENNLIFGFANNALTQPNPVASANNDTSNTPTATSVFLNATSGDFRIDVGGEADETGKNVYNLPTYGSVISDIFQAPRPAAGAWDRGAMKN